MIKMRVLILIILIKFANGTDSSIQFCSSIKDIYKTFNEFNIENCNLQKIDWGDDKKIIKTLRAARNVIQSIEDEDLAGTSELVKIDLSRNQIKEISCDAFKDQSKLTDLKLNFNRLKRLTPGIFDPLKNLERFEARENNLVIIEDELFSNNIKLSWIDFSSNQIIAIHQNSMSVLRSDVFINITGNICDDSTNSGGKLDKCFDEYKSISKEEIEKTCKNQQNVPKNIMWIIFASAIFLLLVIILSICAFYFLCYKPKRTYDDVQPYDSMSIRFFGERTQDGRDSAISNFSENIVTNGENNDAGSIENPPIYALINREPNNVNN